MAHETFPPNNTILDTTTTTTTNNNNNNNNNTMSTSLHEPPLKRFCHRASLLCAQEQMSKRNSNPHDMQLEKTIQQPLLPCGTFSNENVIDPSVNAAALDLLNFASSVPEDDGDRRGVSAVFRSCEGSDDKSSYLTRGVPYPASQVRAFESSDVKAEDVLCGRGLGNSNRLGNVHFRDLIQSYSLEYRQASSTLDKNMIANYIMDNVKPGRFLRREKIVSSPSSPSQTISKFVFVELTKKEALEKTCQALRDASSASHHPHQDKELGDKEVASHDQQIRASPEVHKPTHTTLIDTLRQQQEERSAGSKGEVAVRSTDVLLGRGGFTNHFPGNRHFRKLIVQYQIPYFQASKADKPKIADEIVRVIRNSNGRFLKKISSGEWRDVGDTRAREKVSQALREKGPELKELLGIQKEASSDDEQSKSTSQTQDNNDYHFATDSTQMQIRLDSEVFSGSHFSKSPSPSHESPQWIPPSPLQSSRTIATGPRYDENPSLTSATTLDVLCGRGAGVNRHTGNIIFRDLVASHRKVYKNARTKKLKSSISRSVVDEIHERGGRFLKRANTSYNDHMLAVEQSNPFQWIEIDTEKAVEKASQALREADSDYVPVKARVNSSIYRNKVMRPNSFHHDSYGYGYDIDSV